MDTQFNLQSLVRPNIWSLQPYSCARDEFKGRDAHVFLDANESPYNAPLNRYPDPLQEKLKAQLAPLKGVRPGQIFLGNGLMRKLTSLLSSQAKGMLIASISRKVGQ